MEFIDSKIELGLLDIIYIYRYIYVEKYDNTLKV